MINESTGFNYNVSSPTSITSITIEIYCSYDTIAIKRVFLLLSLINAMNTIISIFKMAHNNSNKYTSCTFTSKIDSSKNIDSIQKI